MEINFHEYLVIKISLEILPLSQGQISPSIGYSGLIFEKLPKFNKISNVTLTDASLNMKRESKDV
jgi:hypothetical protein